MFFQLILLLSGFQSLTVAGEYEAVLHSSNSAISVFDNNGLFVFQFNSQGCERLSHPLLIDSELLCISSDRGLIRTDISTGETSVMSGEGTGIPWVDSNGDLWFTFQGSLYRNGQVINCDVSAFHVSVENGAAAFTDTDDNLHILSLDTCDERIVDDYRFYAPVVLSSSAVMAPTLTGEIVYIAPGGQLSVAAYGEQPTWSIEHDGIFYTVSTDDGHNLTGADIWFVKPGDDPVQITFTSDVYEVKPLWAAPALWYIDGIDGSMNSIVPDAL